MEEYDAELRRNMNRVLTRKRDFLIRLERQVSMGSPVAKIRGYRQYHSQLQDRLEGNMRTILTARRHALELYVEKMKGLSPLEKLSSGYSYVEDAEGRNVRSVTQVREGDKLNVNVKDGQIQVEVKGTSEWKKRKN